MFQNNLIKTTVNSRCYFVLFTMLLMVNGVGADEVADIDPNRSFFGVLQNLWNILTDLISWLS